MGIKKRKQDSDEEEAVDHSASDSDMKLEKSVKTKSTTSTSKGKAALKQKTVKKPKLAESGDDESSPAQAESSQPAVKVHKNAKGEKYVDLGKKKRAAVRSFKGQIFVDIREFYDKDGDEQPGKKGISLAVDQWETLKKSVGTIDSLFAEHSKKS